jgi:hypothetical protein
MAAHLHLPGHHEQQLGLKNRIHDKTVTIQEFVVSDLCIGKHIAVSPLGLCSTIDRCPGAQTDGIDGTPTLDSL